MSKPQVELHIKDHGVITIELDQDLAPKTVKNFLEYVAAKHYDGLIFHRVIPGFMIQGGGFTPNMNQIAVRAEINNEANTSLKNDKYTIAMARTLEPHSATSQFFINASNNNFLNHVAPIGDGWGYAVFGKVIAGADVVDKIEGVKTGSSGIHSNVPQIPVLIEKAVLVEGIELPLVPADNQGVI